MPNEEYKELYDYLNEQYKEDYRFIITLHPLYEDLPSNQQKVYCLLYNIHTKHDLPEIFSETVCKTEEKEFSSSCFSENDITLLATIDFDKVPMALAAKTYAFMWLTMKDYEYAKKAAEYYLKAFKEGFDCIQWGYCIDAIKNSLYFAKKVGYDKCIDNSLGSLFGKMKLVDGKDPSFFTIESIAILIDNKYCDDEKKKICLSIIEKFITAQTTDRDLIANRIDLIEEAHTTKSKLLNKMNKNEDAKKCMVSYADLLVELFEKPNDNRDVFICEKHLKNAMHIYRKNGYPNLANEVHCKLIYVQEKKTKNLHTISKQVDVSKIYNSIQESFNGLSFHEAIVLLSEITKFNIISDIRKKMIDGIYNSPITSLCTRAVMNSKGQTVFQLAPLDINNPEKEMEVFWQYMYLEATYENKIVGGTLLKFALDYIKSNYSFAETDLDFIFNKNKMISEDRIQIWRKGLYLGLSGDIYSSLHLLCPQIENYFRFIAELSGDIVVTLESNGTSKDKVLSSVFELPKLNECFNEDILFSFRGLLNENTGANLRNLIAHGIIGEDEANSGIGLALICMSLKLLASNSPEVKRIIQKSENI